MQKKSRKSNISALVLGTLITASASTSLQATDSSAEAEVVNMPDGTMIIAGDVICEAGSECKIIIKSKKVSSNPIEA